MGTHFVYLSESNEDSVLENNVYTHVTLSSDSGGSGGGAYFMGFVNPLSKYQALINSLSQVTGVSAGGYAAYFLASGRTREAFRFWKQVCSIKSVLRHGSIQKNITESTREMLSRHHPPLLSPLTIFAKMMPSTDPRRITPTLRDRLSSRFGFKIIEFIYWSTGIKQHDNEFALSLPKNTSTQHVTIILEKILVGGARFLPFIMGPTIKINREEAREFKDHAGIVHDYGMITLVGGVESVIPKYKGVEGKTLHFVIVTQDYNEQIWNSLRRNKIRKLVRKYPFATVVLITAKKRLPIAWHRMPNWMSFEKWLLKESYEIGKDTGIDFAERFYPIFEKHSSSK